MTTALRRLVSAIALLLLQAVARTAWAAPSVEGIDLVSETRVSRTVFDYAFSVRVQGDVRSYDTMEMEVASAAPGTSVTKSRVDVGRLDAGQFVRTPGVFVVRHDRAVPFDRSRLTFAFSGTVSPSSDAARAVRVGRVAFAELGGRPGHGVIARLQAESPTAGSTVLLSVALFGGVASSDYALRGTGGAVLATGALQRLGEDGSSEYLAEVQTPQVPFTVSVTARPAVGAATTWQSSVFKPAPVTVKLDTPTAALKYGQRVDARIVATSTQVAGEYEVRLLKPADFGGSAGPWTLVLTPGQASSVPVAIVPPAAGKPFKFFTVGVAYAPKGLPAQVQVANLRFLVE